MKWIVGLRVVGCPPNNIVEFDNWNDAFNFLVDNIELFWDEIENNEDYSLDEYVKLVRSVMNVHTDLHHHRDWNDDLYYVIGNEAFWLVRGE